VEDQSKAEQVRPAVDLLAANLLRRHVLHRARDPRDAGPRGAGVRLALSKGRHAEIEEFHAAGRDHDVLRLQIAMNDALAVRVRERVSHFNRVLHRVLD